MWHEIRALVPGNLKRILRRAAYLSLAQDLSSLLTYRRVVDDRDGKGGLRHVRIRQLKGASVAIRPGSSDADTVFTTYFHRFHLPPRDVRMGSAPLIFDLGANIGLTMAHFANLYPRARVIGVELNHENAMLCRKNIEPWADRCELVEGAVWHEPGELTYRVRKGAEDAFSVTLDMTEGEEVSARALTISELLSQAGDRDVDYLKMDIEGAERTVLRQHTDWAKRVRSIKVELHGDYTPTDAMTDLEQLGFRARRDERHPLCVVGVRN